MILLDFMNEKDNDKKQLEKELVEVFKLLAAVVKKLQHVKDNI